MSDCATGTVPESEGYESNKIYCVSWKMNSQQKFSVLTSENCLTVVLRHNCHVSTWNSTWNSTRNSRRLCYERLLFLVEFHVEVHVDYDGGPLSEWVEPYNMYNMWHVMKEWWGRKSYVCFWETAAFYICYIIFQMNECKFVWFLKFIFYNRTIQLK